MVDALEKSWRAVRPQGIVVDLQPVRPRIARLLVVTRRRRVQVGAVIQDPDEDVIAAHAAIGRAVARGLFQAVGYRVVPYRARFRTLAEFDAERRQHIGWRLAPGTRGRLRAALRADANALIELERHFSVAALRKPG